MLVGPFSCDGRADLCVFPYVCSAWYTEFEEFAAVFGLLPGYVPFHSHPLADNFSGLCSSSSRFEVSLVQIAVLCSLVRPYFGGAAHFGPPSFGIHSFASFARPSIQSAYSNSLKKSD